MEIPVPDTLNTNQAPKKVAIPEQIDVGKRNLLGTLIVTGLAGGLDIASSLLMPIQKQTSTSTQEQIAQMEYAFGEENNIHLIISNHNKPEPYGTLNTDVINPYHDHGDLHPCIYPPETLEMVDDRMRKAKEEGHPYYITVDTTFPLDHLEWWRLPRPERTVRKGFQEREYLESLHAEDYPEIHVLGADIGVAEDPAYNENFLGLTNDLFDDARDDIKFAYQAFFSEINTWFENLSPQDDTLYNTSLTNDIANDTANTLMATTAVGATIAAVNPKMTKRQFLTGVGATAAVIGGTEAVGTTIRSGGMDYLAGMQTNQFVQKVLTDVADQTTDRYNQTELQLLYMNARTAWAIEKSIDAQRHNGNIPVDMLYGSSHALLIPELMQSRENRLAVMKQFLKTVLTMIDTTLKKDAYKVIIEYNDLHNYRERIIGTILKNIPYYSDYTIQMPWGQSKIDPKQYQAFDKNLIKERKDFSCKSIQHLCDSLGQESGVNLDTDGISHFPPRSKQNISPQIAA